MTDPHPENQLSQIRRCCEQPLQGPAAAGTSALVTVADLPDLKQTFNYSELLKELMYAFRDGADTTELQMKVAAGLAAAEDPAPILASSPMFG